MRIIVMTSPNPKRSSPRGEDIPWKSQDNSAPQNTRDKRNEATPQRSRSKSAPRKPATHFTLPDLPRNQWCDIRASYIEKGLTLAELAEIYQCDYRTIKACLIRNKSSKSFGKKSTPTRIDLCKNELQELLRQHLNQLPEDVHSIYQLSCYLLPRLKECGYSGSERTLRNYLHTNPSVKAIFEKGISTHDQDQKHE